MAAVAATWSVAVALWVLLPGLLHQHPAIGRPAIQGQPDRPANTTRALEAERGLYDQRRGYLRAVLDAFDVPGLVAVPSVLEDGRPAGVHQSSPRARSTSTIACIVTHVPGAAQFIEMAVHDPEGGARFYTWRRTGFAGLLGHADCLRCHVASNTMEVPGFIARSIHRAATGVRILSSATTSSITAAITPSAGAAGAVTGAPDTLRHFGNTIVGDPERKPAATASEVPTLEGRAPAERYLSPYSESPRGGLRPSDARDEPADASRHGKRRAAAEHADVKTGTRRRAFRETAAICCWWTKRRSRGPSAAAPGSPNRLPLTARRTQTAVAARLRSRSRLFRYPGATWSTRP